MEKSTRKKFICYFLIIITSIIMCIPLFQNGIHTGHDGEFHISRVFGTIEQIINGNSPFVISRFSNNLGFGWNLFYPPVSTCINILFAFLTNNVVIAMKLFIFFTFLASGIAMFQLVDTLTKNKLIALISSILYIIAPYRLLNAYTRLAVGEILSFIFIPIILRGVYLIFDGKTEKSYLYVLGTIGLVLSHNISTLLTFLIGLAYVLINFKKLKDKKILKTLIISTLIIILSVLFFEIPLLEQKSSADYEVFRYGKMYSKFSVFGHALNPLQLLYRNASGADSSMYFCIGIPILICVLLFPIIRNKISSENRKNYKFFAILGIIATVMSTSLFPWYLMPDILLMIQFPWRLLVIIVFCFSIIGGINLGILIELIKEKFKNKLNIKLLILPISIIYILCCLYSLSFVKNLDLKVIDNSYFTEEEIIDTTNQVSRYSSFLEYWPQKAIDSIDYIVSHDNKIHILSGEANIVNENKENGILTFEINNIIENTTLELPFLFYKGYEVKYTSYDNNKPTFLDCSESDNGLVQISLDSSINGTFEVSYHATITHKICIVISSVTFLFYLIYIFINYKKSTQKSVI